MVRIAVAGDAYMLGIVAMHAAGTGLRLKDRHALPHGHCY
jgi:hypothetical protein